jgi:SAM-dependent methyltransferase
MMRALHRLLGRPQLYRLTEWFFNADAYRRQTVQRAGYRAGMRTLDVGCGTGDLAQYIAPADYVGVDISAAYIEQARRDYGGRFHVLPAERITELPDRFDLAFLFGLLHHLPDPAVGETLEALNRVLAPGGYAYIVEAMWPTRFWNLAGYALRKLDRGAFVRTPPQWRALLGARCAVERERIARNRFVEYYECVLRRPS